MNIAVEKLFLDAASNKHLDWLESEAIHIMREVAAECSNPALLFSGGKDSVVLLRIAGELTEGAFRFLQCQRDASLVVRQGLVGLGLARSDA